MVGAFFVFWQRTADIVRLSFPHTFFCPTSLDFKFDKIAGVGCKIVAQFEEKQPYIIVNTLRSAQHRDKSYHLCSICNRQQELTPMRTLVKLIRDESGATAIEYGLIAAGISIAIIATVNALGTQLNTTFNSVSTALK
jgi:pilus assembly protein Flp/PilA